MNQQEKHEKEMKEMVQLRKDLNSDKGLVSTYSSGKGYFTPAEIKKVYETMGRDYQGKDKCYLEGFVDDARLVKNVDISKIKWEPVNIEDLLKGTKRKVNPTKVNQAKFNQFGEIIGVFVFGSLTIASFFILNNLTGYSVFNLENTTASFFWLILGIIFSLIFSLFILKYFLKRRKK